MRPRGRVRAGGLVREQINPSVVALQDVLPSRTSISSTGGCGDVTDRDEKYPTKEAPRYGIGLAEPEGFRVCVIRGGSPRIYAGKERFSAPRNSLHFDPAL
jgi:hypothetical protein